MTSPIIVMRAQFFRRAICTTQREDDGDRDEGRREYLDEPDA